MKHYYKWFFPYKKIHTTLFITKEKLRQQNKIKTKTKNKNGNNKNKKSPHEPSLIPYTCLTISCSLTPSQLSSLSLSLCCCNSKYTKREKLVSLSLLFCWVSPMCVFFLSPLTLIYPLLFFFSSFFIFTSPCVATMFNLLWISSAWKGFNRVTS